MLVVFAVGSAMSSLSQRRPRAIEAIRRARFSERIARASCGLADSGTSISRLDPGNVGVDEDRVRNLRGLIEVIANRFYDQALDFGCRNTINGSGSA
jgi:hypothetical protein